MTNGLWDNHYAEESFDAGELIELLKQFPKDTPIYIGLKGIPGGSLARCVCGELDGTITITNERKGE